MMPAPPVDKGLTESEYGYILDTALSEKHRKDERIVAFIEAFVRCKDIRQASGEVGVVPSLGYKWRHRTDVANAIQKIWDKNVVKYGMDTSEIFEKTKEIVEFDPILVMNPDGTFKSNLYDIDPEARRCLKKLKVKNLWGERTDRNGMKEKLIVGEVIEYEFYDKLKAAELVGKEKEMFKNVSKVEHDVTKNMKDVLLESTKRANARLEPVTIEAEYDKRD